LIWTIGFSGKRFLSDEEKVSRAIKEALGDLLQKAEAAGARLTAISSLARGADILFAEACEELGISWRYLVPFAWEAFLQLDLATDQRGTALPVEEHATLRARAERLRSISFGEAPARQADESNKDVPNVFPDPAVVTQGVVISEPESLDSAYQDCSYRTVDEADVMIFVLRDDEFRAVVNASENREDSPPEGSRAGTKPTALYAKAARRPCILLNADAADPWVANKVLNDPLSAAARIHSARHKPPAGWFIDPVVTPTVAEALSWNQPQPVKELTKSITPERKCVWEFMRLLEGVAVSHQRLTKSGLSRILKLHLAATFIAALCATVLAYMYFPWWFLGLAGLAFLKSSLVYSAWLKERRLHRCEHRDRWLNARILAEFCRSAIAMWPLPLQPLDASDEEDFPRLKRLIRTLRLMRAMDGKAAVRDTPRQPFETSLEANMREACDDYLVNRLLHQANDYYKAKRPQHVQEEDRWRFGFQASLWCAIAAGLIVAGLHLWEHQQSTEHAGGQSPASEVADFRTSDVQAGTHLGPMHYLEKSLEALLIIAPFFATYCLGMITILDSRRRSSRYEEMRHYLKRLADTLANCTSNPSRLRLIEHAERMLIEEQHEWFSATRNANV
jgi:hypothetical protein